MKTLVQLYLHQTSPFLFLAIWSPHVKKEKVALKMSINVHATLLLDLRITAPGSILEFVDLNSLTF